ncbi:nuclear transport factor 2 family protein [Nocardia jiangxiensis]|uniref:Nuclear transport factor 2 family protein n=1 Tax=Nocardia jiangxiensis TaxID=282685 RepID=A0ABW6SGG8_9NOCA|nr:nuclear transport factor 2 family protein [Nocardia jiangxiensis]
MSGEELAELRERVRRLEAAEIAREHLHAYARILDDPRPETVTALFAPAAVLTTPSRKANGRAEIREFYEWAFRADASIKRHFITNARTTWLGDSRVRVQAQVLFTGRGTDRSVVGWGSYDDIVDVSGPQPRFTEKHMVIEVSTDLVAGWPHDSEVR